MTQICGGEVRFASPENSSLIHHMQNSIFPCSLESGIIWVIKALWPVKETLKKRQFMRISIQLEFENSWVYSKKNVISQLIIKLISLTRLLIYQL